MPVTLMLATLTERRDFGDDFLLERKFDGERCVARKDGGELRLESRTGKDLTSTYPEVLAAAASQQPRNFLLDGEVVAYEGEQTSFSRLQQRLGVSTPSEQLVADYPYVRGRSKDWLKLKCAWGQELVIGGYTDPAGSCTDFGALLVGYYEDGRLLYAGKVGTGYRAETLRDLGARLRALEAPTSPFVEVRPTPRGTHWTRPELVAQVGFAEWTSDGRLRQPRFLGLRDDKAPADV